ncbi:hypothetical protein D3C84_1055200 [compost metagenome]
MKIRPLVVCPFGNNDAPVGASLLAMDVNDDAGFLIERGALKFFASKLAPTVDRSCHPRDDRTVILRVTTKSERDWM